MEDHLASLAGHDPACCSAAPGDRYTVKFSYDPDLVELVKNTVSTVGPQLGPLPKPSDGRTTDTPAALAWCPAAAVG